MAKVQPFLNAALSGDKELLELFGQLPNALGEKALQAAGVKALQPVAAAARAIVARQSVDEGDLERAIMVSTRLSARQRKIYRRRGLVYAYAGVADKAAPHGVLVEFGTTERFTKRGDYKGKMPSEAFMRPAWDANSNKVLATMRAEIWAELVKAVRKLRKQADRGKVGKSIARQILAKG